MHYLQSLGWSIDAVALYLAIVMAILFPVSVSSGYITKLLTDRKGMIISSASAVLGSIFLFGYSTNVMVGDVAVYTVGSMIVLASVQIMRGFNWAITTKIIPTHYSSKVVSRR